MNETLFEKLVEISWRRKLTPEEEVALQSWLASHPGDAERWELESGLTQALERLATVAPSSNFTSRVVAMVELDQKAARRRLTWRERLRRLVLRPKAGLAWASVLVTVAVLAFQLQLQQQRQIAQGQMRQALQSLSAVASVASPETLEDFEVIREFANVRMESNPTDEALFVLLDQ